MGARGPKPKPQKLRDLEGNPGKQKKQPAPIKTYGELRQPGWIAKNETAAAVWDDVVSAMPPDFYSQADNQLLAAYCSACAMMQEAMADIAEDGLTISNENGKQKNPAVTILEGAQAKIATLGTRLALDVATRSALVGSAPPPEKPKGKFAELIPIKGGKAKG